MDELGERIKHKDVGYSASLEVLDGVLGAAQKLSHTFLAPTEVVANPTQPERNTRTEDRLPAISRCRFRFGFHDGECLSRLLFDRFRSFRITPMSLATLSCSRAVSEITWAQSFTPL